MMTSTTNSGLGSVVVGAPLSPGESLSDRLSVRSDTPIKPDPEGARMPMDQEGANNGGGAGDDGNDSDTNDGMMEGGGGGVGGVGGEGVNPENMENPNLTGEELRICTYRPVILKLFLFAVVCNAKYAFSKTSL